MTDGTEGTGAGTGAGTSEAEGGGTGAGAGAGGASAGGEALAGGAADGQAPEWLSTLPDDLKGDDLLVRYKSVEDLARGHLEARKLASQRLKIPGADAKPEEWGALFDALGRPKEAKDYEVPMPALPEGIGDEQKAAMTAAFEESAAPFRALAHEIGLLPAQAKRLAEFENARIQAAEAAHYEKGRAELRALKRELKEKGVDYDAELEKAKGIYKALGLPVEFADELDRKVGSAALVRGFIRLARVAGEHVRVVGDGGELGGGGDDAEAQLSAKFKDKGWRDRFEAGDPATVAEHDRLHALATKQAVRRAG